MPLPILLDGNYRRAATRRKRTRHQRLHAHTRRLADCPRTTDSRFNSVYAGQLTEPFPVRTTTQVAALPLGALWFTRAMGGPRGNEDRTLKVDGLVNGRDLGGLRRVDGTVTPRGVFFRSENVDWITGNGWQQIHDAGIRTVVDLRQQGERNTDVRERPGWLTAIHVDLDGLENKEFWAAYWDNRLVGTALYFLMRGQQTANETTPNQGLRNCAGNTVQQPKARSGIPWRNSISKACSTPQRSPTRTGRACSLGAARPPHPQTGKG